MGFENVGVWACTAVVAITAKTAQIRTTKECLIRWESFRLRQGIPVGKNLDPVTGPVRVKPLPTDATAVCKVGYGMNWHREHSALKRGGQLRPADGEKTNSTSIAAKTCQSISIQIERCWHHSPLRDTSRRSISGFTSRNSPFARASTTPSSFAISAAQLCFRPKELA